MSGLVVLYLATRLYRLLSVPIFVDEAFHIERAKWAASGSLQTGAATGRWLSIQAYGLWFRIVGDSLLTARLLAVLLGLATLVVLYSMATSFGSRPRPARGLLAGLAYVVVPFALFYDRQALTDEFETLLLAVLLLLCFRYAASGKCSELAAVCATLVLAPLFKINGFLMLPVPLLIVATAARSDSRRARLRRLAIPYGACAALVVGLVAAYVRFMPGNDALARTSLSSPPLRLVALVATNLRGIWELSWTMLTPTMIALVVLAPLAILLLPTELGTVRRTAGLLLVLAWLVGSHAVFFETWYPRYLVAAIIPVCLIVAEGVLVAWDALGSLPRWRSIALRGLVLTLLVAGPVRSSAHLLHSPETFALPRIDRWQYYTSWASGYGVVQAVSEVRQLADRSVGGIVLLQPPSMWAIPAYRREIGPAVDVLALKNWNTDALRHEIEAHLAQGKPVYIMFDNAVSDDRATVSRVVSWFDALEIARYPRLDGYPGLVILRVSASVRP